MRSEISDKDFDIAFENANQEISLFISSLNDDSFSESLKDLNIPDPDIRQIRRELIYVALGLARKDEFLDNVLLNTEGDEESISLAVDFILQNILPSIADKITVPDLNPTNQSAKKVGENPNKRTSADILLKEIGVHDAPDSEHHDSSHDFVPSKKDLLSEIETPTETVIRPDFALPKSKPATSEILKNIADAPYTMADTIKIEDGDHNFTVIDPFKKMRDDEKLQNQIADEKANEKAKSQSDFRSSYQPQRPYEPGSGYFNQTPTSIPKPELKIPDIQSSIISSNDPALMTEPNPVANIKTNFDKKLNSVITNSASPSYKLNGDPYREPLV